MFCCRLFSGSRRTGLRLSELLFAPALPGPVRFAGDEEPAATVSIRFMLSALADMDRSTTRAKLQRQGGLTGNACGWNKLEQMADVSHRKPPEHHIAPTSVRLCSFVVSTPANSSFRCMIHFTITSILEVVYEKIGIPDRWGSVRAMEAMVGFVYTNELIGIPERHGPEERGHSIEHK